MAYGTPFFRWYLSTRPYSDGNAHCTMSTNNDLDPLHCSGVELLRQLGSISALYDREYSHWFVLIDYTRGGDLSTQRRHLHAEGLCPTYMPRWDGNGLIDRRAEVAAWAEGEAVNS